jgi:DNA-binding CsgD family transcriptional regulator
MNPSERALQLVECIYASVVEPDAWNTFLGRLSEALGGAAIQLALRRPDAPPSPDTIFNCGLDEAYRGVFLKHVIEGLPWSGADSRTFQGRFARASEVHGDSPAHESPFYREFMAPQGLAAEWPICHMIATHEGRPLAGVVIYRREGGRPLGEADLALLDSLVPHLARAYALQSRLANARHQSNALTEVIDRFITGVILLDAEGRSLLMNRSALGILDLRDGIRLERGRVRLDDAREDRGLQAIIADVVGSRDGAHRAGGVLGVSRPSGRRAFPVWVGPLLAPAPGQAADEVRGILFVADPESAQLGPTDVLQSLYQLTRAEAELVRLIAEGCSLEQVAAKRGVTMNTVRSQLKQVFSKTDTSRQGELVHLVLTGVAPIRTSEAQPDPRRAQRAAGERSEGPAS